MELLFNNMIRWSLGIAFVHGAPNNSFCRLEKGEIKLKQVRFQGEWLIDSLIIVL